MSVRYYGRPTRYKGVRMRSRLEAATAAAFDRHEIPWEYEPEALQGADGQYLPDFTIIVDVVSAKPMNDPAFPGLHENYWITDQLVYVEIKPTRQKQLDVLRAGLLAPVFEIDALAMVLVPTSGSVIFAAEGVRGGRMGGTHCCLNCGALAIGPAEDYFDDCSIYPDCRHCGQQLWLEQPLLEHDYWTPTPTQEVLRDTKVPDRRTLGKVRRLP